MRYSAMLLSIVLVGSLLAAGGTATTGLDAVALRPDGKQLAVGGHNRVIYLVDPATLTVTARHWLGVRITSLAYSTDGSRLVVEDESDGLHLIDPATGKTLLRLADLRGLAVQPGGSLIALSDRSEPLKPRIRLLALRTLKEHSRIDLPGAAVAHAFTPDGKQLLVLGLSEVGDEKKVPLAEVPTELKGLARWTFRMKHDGRQCILWSFDVATGKRLSQQRLWYTSDSESTLLARSGAVTYVLNRVNLCARIGADGETTLFETSRRVNHALGVSPDGKILLVGGLGEGTAGPMEGGKPTTFTLPDLPGRGEWFTRFLVQTDGSAWGVTTAFRLVRITPGGKIERIAAIY